MQINELFSGIPNLQPCFTTSTLTDRLTETKLKRMSRFVTPLYIVILSEAKNLYASRNHITLLQLLQQSILRIIAQFAGGITFLG